MMGKKKRRLIMIMSILLAIILIVAITYGIIYSSTDLLKSNKEIFYKYLAKNNLTNIIDTNWIKRYEAKNNSSPYQDKGKITFNQESSNKNDNSNDKLLNNLTLEFEGKANLAEGLQDQTVKLNYNNNEILKLDYLRTEDIYGVKIDDVIDKYLAFKNGDIKEFLKKMEIRDYENIPNKIEPLQITEVLELIETNKDKVKEKLIKIIDSEIVSASYKNSKKSEIQIEDKSYTSDAYYVELTDVQVSNITRKMLEYIRDDEEILNTVILLAKGKSNEENDRYIMKEKIEKSISELKRKSSNNEIQLTLTIYVKEKDLIAIGIKFNDNNIIISNMDSNEVILERKRKENEDEYTSKIKILKNINEEEYQLTISNIEKLNESDASKTTIKLDLSNDLESNSIENKIEFSSNIRGDKMGAKYVDRKSYVSDLDILQFNDENSQKINDFSKEDNEYLASAISTRIVEVFEEKMKSIGIEVKMLDVVEEYNRKIEAQKQKEEDEKKATEYTGTETKLDINQITEFNKPYEEAQEKKMKGKEYKEFLEYVLESNENNPKDQQVKVYISSIERNKEVSKEQFKEYIENIDTDIENTRVYKVKIGYSQGTSLVNKLEIR